MQWLKLLLSVYVFTFQGSDVSAGETHAFDDLNNLMEVILIKYFILVLLSIPSTKLGVCKQKGKSI